MKRIDGRRPDELRPVQAVRGYSEFAEGSVLYEAGKTKVLVTASYDDRVPDFLRGTGRGWVTAEYSMLPRATDTRTPRESSRGRVGGRTQEIQRLIGRSLRAICDMSKMGECAIWLDCDVLQADGGTRTAAITAAYLALADACSALVSDGRLRASPIREETAAVSVGIVEGTPILDLCYAEDSAAEVDMNVVMTASGNFVEVQGTAEAEPFSEKQLTEMLDLARAGIEQLISLQREILEQPINR
jgi:ribonuclease PH